MLKIYNIKFTNNSGKYFNIELLGDDVIDVTITFNESLNNETEYTITEIKFVRNFI
jgi:hypothetical protein